MDKDEASKKLALTFIVGTILFFVFQAIARGLVLSGWLMRGNGWQEPLAVGRWMWIFTLLVLSVLSLSATVGLFVIKKKLSLMDLIIGANFCFSQLFCLFFLLASNIELAIYIYYVGAIVSPLLKLFQGDKQKMQSSLRSFGFGVATLIAFLTGSAPVVFVLIFAQIAFGIPEIRSQFVSKGIL